MCITSSIKRPSTWYRVSPNDIVALHEALLLETAQVAAAAAAAGGAAVPGGVCEGDAAGEWL